MHRTPPAAPRDDGPPALLHARRADGAHRRMPIRAGLVAQWRARGRTTVPARPGPRWGAVGVLGVPLRPYR
ncbi:hypothetical protein ACWCPF_33715 [Streptomyces sp. NPDC001858]